MPLRMRHHLTNEEAARALELLCNGHSQRHVAGRFNVSLGSINRLWQRFRETGRSTRRPGQGRHRITSQEEDRYIRILACRNRQSSARSLATSFRDASHHALSDQTIRNRLHEAGMHARRPAARPILSQRHREARLSFSQEHVGWSMDQWAPVLFTDESRFNLSNNDRRVRVWRRAGERFADCNVVEYDRYGGGSVMVWGGICLNGHTDLVVLDRGSITGMRYVEEVLHPVVRLFHGAIGENFLLMHDNARPHIATVVREYLESLGIEAMDWPARSPDLNPIEHAWDMLGRRIQRRQPAPTTVRELEVALVEEWESIPQDSFRILIQSMPRRLQECIQARGGHTSY